MAGREGWDWETFLQHYPVDEKASAYLTSSPPEVQARVIQEFKPPREGEADYSALLVKFTARCRKSSAPVPPPQAQPQQGMATHAGTGEMEMTEQLQDFVQRYPMDQEAMNYLTASGPDVQNQVFQNFSPKTQGEADYSALIISFTKRCRNGVRSQSGPPPGMPTAAHHMQQHHRFPPIVHQPSYEEQLMFDVQTFLQRFPCDEAATTYLTTSAANVQAQVVRDFKPKTEGDRDYSALVITFTKKCRSGAPPAPHHMQLAPASFPPQEHWAPPPQQHWGPPDPAAMGWKGGGHWRGPEPYPYPHGHSQGKGYWQGSQPHPSHAPHDDFTWELQCFRDTFPMDDRAWAYVQELPPAARRMLLDTFVPPRSDDVDYSAPVIAYAKKCRIRTGTEGLVYRSEGYSPGYGPGYGGGCGNGSAGDMWGKGQSAPRDMWGKGHGAPMPPAAEPNNDEVNAFFERYPIDDRAKTYLLESPAHVVDRVLREFKVKREGESDYSGAVVAYVKKCRGADGMGGGPLQKRPRFG